MLCLLFGFWERFWLNKPLMLQQPKDLRQKSLEDPFTLWFLELEWIREWWLKEILIQSMLIMSWAMSYGSWSKPTTTETSPTLPTTPEESQWRRKCKSEEISTSTNKFFWTASCPIGPLSTSQQSWLRLWSQPLDTITPQFGMEKTLSDPLIITNSTLY